MDGVRMGGCNFLTLTEEDAGTIRAEIPEVPGTQASLLDPIEALRQQ